MLIESTLCVGRTLEGHLTQIDGSVVKMPRYGLPVFFPLACKAYFTGFP